MPLAHDILSDEDRRLLQEFATRIRPHVSEVIADWVAAWQQAIPAPAVDPDAYRQVLAYSMENSMRPVFELLAAGDFDALYTHE